VLCVTGIPKPKLIHTYTHVHAHTRTHARAPSAGGMYNIIRGTPMFATDSAGKMLFFSGSRCASSPADGQFADKWD